MPTESCLCYSIFKGCEVLIDGMVLKANLIPLKIYDFDKILGMDWLSTHRASVDYFTKKVVFQKPGFPKLDFVGDRRILSTCVILALEAKRLHHKGCEAYLAPVSYTSTPKVTLKSVLIVREFSNVFLEDLSGLPPNRELEFGIELLPRSAPSSIPLYRMTPTVLKELKT